MLIGFLLGGVCFAQDYYALIEIMIKNDSGTAFVMNTVTKVPDTASCSKILSPIDQLKDKYVVRTECVSGPKWDDLLRDTFANKPTGSIYISYKDGYGFETRINSKVLAGKNSSTPGQLIEPPVQTTVAWANAMIETLEKGGIKNARIIYPRTNK